MKRQYNGSAPGPVTPILATAQPDESEGLTYLPVWRIAALISSREVSPVEVTKHFLARIEELDHHYHAFRTVDFKGARAQAEAAEAAIRGGERGGPLHGIPLAVKEHIPVAGLNYWNSFDGTHAPAPRDGIEAERLRAAGTIMVGTTVAGLTAREFGTSPDQPQNPWDPARVCGDSSGGSAAALAAAMVPAAIAVDGLGSTRLPASFCGLVGLNPTRGRVPWTSWSTVNPRLLSNTGPLTRDVRDAALIMQVLAGPDGRDLMARPDEPPDYDVQLGQGLEGLNLAWSDDPFDSARDAGSQAATVIASVREAARHFAEGGARLNPISEKVTGSGPASLSILGADRTMATRTEASEDVVIHAKEARKRVIDWLDVLFRQYDALVTPTVMFVAPTREEWASAWADPSYMLSYTTHTAASNLTGYPAISVPAGLVGGMPVGLQIYGRPDSEPLLFRLAQAFLTLRGTS